MRSTTALEFSASKADRSAPTRLSALASSSATIMPFTSTNAVWAPVVPAMPSPMGDRIRNSNPNRYPKDRHLKKIPQRRLRRCSACSDITSFSISRQSRPDSGGSAGRFLPNQPRLPDTGVRLLSSGGTGSSPHPGCLSDSQSLIRHLIHPRSRVRAVKAQEPAADPALNLPRRREHTPATRHAYAPPTQHRSKAYRYAEPSPGRSGCLRSLPPAPAEDHEMPEFLQASGGPAWNVSRRHSG